MAVTKVPWNAIWPCAIMVFLIYLYLAVDIFKPFSMDYMGYNRFAPLEPDRRDPALVGSRALLGADARRSGQLGLRSHL